MAGRRADDFDEPKPKRRRAPATSPEARELQLGSMAYDLAEQQFADGTASSQVTVHFLKAVSHRESLERERLYNENALLRKKLEDLDTAVQVKVLLDDAMKAFRGYKGEPDPEDEYED